MLRSLKDSGPGARRPLGDARAQELEGIFQKLTEPEQFRRILMPGLSEEERTSAPSSLQVTRLPDLVAATPMRCLLARLVCRSQKSSQVLLEEALVVKRARIVHRPAAAIALYLSGAPGESIVAPFSRRRCPSCLLLLLVEHSRQFIPRPIS